MGREQPAQLQALLWAAWCMGVGEEWGGEGEVEAMEEPVLPRWRLEGGRWGR